MRIVYISSSVMPSERANSVNTIKMCEALQKNGNYVRLVIPSFKNGKSPEEIKEYYKVDHDFEICLVKVPKFKGWLLFYGFYLLSLISGFRKETDLIIGRFPWGLYLTSLLGIPQILDLHGVLWKSGILNKYSIKKIAKSSKTLKITFNTPQLLSIFKKDFENRVSPGLKLEAYSNGANISLKENSETLRLKGNASFNVGYIGSLYSGRGIEVIIEMAKNLPEVVFHLAGGPESLAKKYQDEIHLNNLFFYGHIPYKDTDAFRNACDVLLAPYQDDVKVPSGEITADYMSPIKIFEYMASKKAIIASDLPALREVLNQGNAILCNSRQTAEWIAAVQKLQKDTEFRNALADKAYKDFINAYTWTKRAEYMIAG